MTQILCTVLGFFVVFLLWTKVLKNVQLYCVLDDLMQISCVMCYVLAELELVVFSLSCSC